MRKLPAYVLAQNKTLREVIVQRAYIFAVSARAALPHSRQVLLETATADNQIYVTHLPPRMPGETQLAVWWALYGGMPIDSDPEWNAAARLPPEPVKTWLRLCKPDLRQKTPALWRKWARVKAISLGNAGLSSRQTQIP